MFDDGVSSWESTGGLGPNPPMPPPPGNEVLDSHAIRSCDQGLKQSGGFYINLRMLPRPKQVEKKGPIGISLVRKNGPGGHWQQLGGSLIISIFT